MNFLFFQLLLVGLVSGLFVGMFGIGGGAIMVPAMVLLLGLDQKLASGTSLAAQILPIGLLGAVVYYQNGNINIKYALLIAAGLLIGAFFGAKFTNLPTVSSAMIKNIFGVFLILVGLRYLFIK